MKIKSVRLSCLLVIICFFISLSQNQATTYRDDTDLGITFKKEKGTIVEDDKPPLIDGGNNKPPVRMLPQTGEMLTSLIVILLGLSLFIFSIGIFTIKHLYREPGWEGMQ